MYRFYKIIFCVLLILMVGINAISAERIGKTFIHKKNVFDSTQKNWFFLAPFLNAIRPLTRDYIIEDEVLFSEEQDISEDLIYETERNLRNTGLFTNVSIMLDSVNDYKYDAHIFTQDKWSFYTALLLGTGGGVQNLGGRFEELNLLGTGNQISVEALHRSENNIGWQYAGALSLRKLVRTDFNLDLYYFTNKIRDTKSVQFSKPFKSLDDVNSYGAFAYNSNGDDFLYRYSDSVRLMPFHENKMQFWYSQAWRKIDRVFITIFGEYQEVDRGDYKYDRAYDNCGKVLIAFSSVSENYHTTSKLNGFLQEDLPIGGWGTATLGKVFPIGHKGMHLYYVGAQGEKSWLFDNLYFFGQMTGASSFARDFGFYTYQEFMGLAFYKINPDLLIAGKIRQQTVWNWWELRQLILDNSTGLRGYRANQLTGDNRIVGNLELRYFPDYEFWIFKLSPTAFYDFGTVWEQNTRLNKTQWHHSIGAGIRIHNMTATGPGSIFRIDFAYNFDERRLGEIIFTSDQLFSIFQSHKYKLPEIYGREFDYE